MQSPNGNYQLSGSSSHTLAELKEKTDQWNDYGKVKIYIWQPDSCGVFCAFLSGNNLGHIALEIERPTQAGEPESSIYISFWPTEPKGDGIKKTREAGNLSFKTDLESESKMPTYVKTLFLNCAAMLDLYENFMPDPQNPTEFINYQQAYADNLIYYSILGGSSFIRKATCKKDTHYQCATLALKFLDAGGLKVKCLTSKNIAPLLKIIILSGAIFLALDLLNYHFVEPNDNSPGDYTEDAITAAIILLIVVLIASVAAPSFAYELGNSFIFPLLVKLGFSTPNMLRMIIDKSPEHFYNSAKVDALDYLKQDYDQHHVPVGVTRNNIRGKKQQWFGDIGRVTPEGRKAHKVEAPDTAWKKLSIAIADCCHSPLTIFSYRRTGYQAHSTVRRTNHAERITTNHLDQPLNPGNEAADVENQLRAPSSGGAASTKTEAPGDSAEYFDVENSESEAVSNEEAPGLIQRAVGYLGF